MNRSITVRLPAGQYDALYEQAKAQGFSTPSAYIRAVAVERPEAGSRVLKALLGEMGRSSHRLTELARRLDAQAAPCPALEAQLVELLDFLRFTLGEILTEVRALR